MALWLINVILKVVHVLFTGNKNNIVVPAKWIQVGIMKWTLSVCMYECVWIAVKLRTFLRYTHTNHGFLTKRESKWGVYVQSQDCNSMGNLTLYVGSKTYLQANLGSMGITSSSLCVYSSYTHTFILTLTHPRRGEGGRGWVFCV